MKAAYIDTSCLVAIALSEPGATRLARSLRSYDHLLASNLLEAELRSVLHRERITKDPSPLLAGIHWAYPDRSLTAEMTTIQKVGYVRGADLWHLAVALFIDPEREIHFLTLDDRQREVSRQLGFGG
ncbi:MAG: hypothetical protein DMF59_10295 [Acidobacteria bacterium]|nr:MAG: hypothetical protein DMF59_10295 [Acidobacteriota bacterium]